MSFKTKLRNGILSLGTWITIPSTSVAEIICSAGFDWVAIDLEHSCMTTMDAQELIRVIDLKGKVPLVRLSSNDEVLIKRVMDAGAHGVIVPMINTLEDTKHAYESIHYPPNGRRGVGLARAQKYGAGFKDYWEWLAKEAVLVVQIEHKNALGNLDQIFGSGLVDGYLIGPYDLSASLGIPGQFDHPDLIAALEKIAKAAEKHKVPRGIHLVEMDEKALKDKISAGYKLIAYGVDFRLLDSGYRTAIQQLEKLKS